MTQTVVIIEENALCARLYRAMLEPLPCRVLLARSADDAVRMVQDAADPALGDLPADPPSRSAPDRSAARARDEAQRAPQPGPIFVVAARSQAERATRAARTAGGDAIVVAKPVRGDGLTTLVRRHLGRR